MCEIKRKDLVLCSVFTVLVRTKHIHMYELQNIRCVILVFLCMNSMHLYLHLKLALYNIGNAKIYANNFKVCFITLFLLRMTLSINTSKKSYDRSRKRS